jgi:Tfp pilus assembly PilM family ATPase
MAFLEEINQFMMQHDLSPGNVAISLPRSRISLQSMELPAPDRNTIAAMIGFELEKHFFSKPEDLYFTYHATELPENRFHIVLSAVKKETADYYLQLVERLGLKVTTMDVSTLSNFNLLTKDQTKNQVIAMIDLCSNAFDISLIKNGNIELSRNIPIKNPATRNSYFLNDLPAKHYETLSNELGKEIIDEILSTLSCCDRIGKDEKIEHIYILGGGPYAKTLQIGERAGAPTTNIDLPHGLNAPLPLNFDLAYSSASLALALRELRRSAIETNLLPATLSPRKKRINIKTTIGMSLAVILLLIGFIAGKTIYKRKALASIEKQLQELKLQVAPLEKIDLDYEGVKPYIDAIDAIKKLSPQKLPVLEELTRALPPNTWLTEISVIKDKVEIKGISATASALIPLLENSPHFKDAGFNGSIIKTPEGERFTIRLNLKERK